jgi:hypothetical protein
MGQAAQAAAVGGMAPALLMRTVWAEALLTHQVGPVMFDRRAQATYWDPPGEGVATKTMQLPASANGWKPMLGRSPNLPVCTSFACSWTSIARVYIMMLR